MYTEHRTEWSKTCDATQTKSDNTLMGQPTSLNAKAMKFWYTGKRHKQIKINKDSGSKKTVAMSASGTRTTAWLGTDEKQQQWHQWHQQATPAWQWQQQKPFLQDKNSSNNCVVQPKYTASTWQDQHNTISTTKLSKASALTCGICETEQIAKGTKLLNNWMKVMVPNNIKKQQTNTVSLRHTTNTAQLKKCFTQNTFVCFKNLCPNANINKTLSLFRFTCLFTCFVFVYDSIKFYGMF